MENSPTSNLERVKEILLSDYASLFEQRLAELEKKFEQETEDLHKKHQKLKEDLMDFVEREAKRLANEIKTLAVKMKSADSNLDTKIRHLSTDLADLYRQIERDKASFNRLIENLNQKIILASKKEEENNNRLETSVRRLTEALKEQSQQHLTEKQNTMALLKLQIEKLALDLDVKVSSESKLRKKMESDLVSSIEMIKKTLKPSDIDIT